MKMQFEVNGDEGQLRKVAMAVQESVRAVGRNGDDGMSDMSYATGIPEEDVDSSEFFRAPRIVVLEEDFDSNDFPDEKQPIVEWINDPGLPDYRKRMEVELVPGKVIYLQVSGKMNGSTCYVAKGLIPFEVVEADDESLTVRWKRAPAAHVKDKWQS